MMARMTPREETLEEMDEVMWDYSAPEPDDEMVSRCNYCGRFSHKSALDAKTSLCMKCMRELHPDKVEEEQKEGEEKMGNDDQADAESTASKRVDADYVHAAEQKNAAVAADADADADVDANVEDEAEETMEHPQSDEDKQAGTGEDTCARCWVNKATGVLYNSPICGRCMEVAESKRQGKGTNKRFQPPTPSLQPGKRLTRVCDSCRRKRKRCQHRRVVDADDPEAHRRKRTKKETEQQMAKDPKNCRAPKKKKALRELLPTIVEASGSESEVGASGRGLNDAVTPNHVGMHDEEEEAYDSDSSSSNDNLQRAINDSMNLVYKRELLRLEEVAQEKIEEANRATEAVKKHLKAWNKYLLGQK